MLSKGPIPLQSILDLIPSSAGSKAAFLLRTLAAGACLCDLLEPSSDGHPPESSERCRCAQKLSSSE